MGPKQAVTVGPVQVDKLNQLRDADEAGEQEQMPHLVLAKSEEDSEHHEQNHARHVTGEHEPAAVEAIDDDAGGHGDQQRRQRAGQGQRRDGQWVFGERARQ